MKTLIVVAHPMLSGSSTQAFLKAGAALVPDATWHPVPEAPDVLGERAQLQAADRIIFQFPLTWYTAPATLTAWLSKVWAMNFATSLANKELGVVVTMGRPERDYHPGAAVGVSLDALLAPYMALAHTAKMRWLAPLVVAQFVRMPDNHRQRLLIRYQQYLSLPEQTFAAQAAWWLDALAQKPEADLLQSELADRQARLADLRQALKEAQDD
ncbi:NAD(P)H-dependent oxidoreductase [Lacticaseibacillus sp. GG6-2]